LFVEGGQHYAIEALEENPCALVEIFLPIPPRVRNVAEVDAKAAVEEQCPITAVVVNECANVFEPGSYFIGRS
jgi:hypothetical protein